MSLLAALVVVQTVGDEDGVTVDARLPVLAVAALAVSRGAPFVVTVVLAAATAALLCALV